jgi:type IV pilus assembly protein PilM
MMGGNTFTTAIAETFKLSFEKAEKLKRTAPVSKYARQIFQAMRPVFTDWSGEVQRSLGFYTNSNPDVKIARVIAMGGGTKLRGLVKYLSQTLQIPVEKPDAFKRLAVAPGISAAKFHENVSDFGVVYGLGLQGLGMARIESNLLPKSIARSMAWAGKMKYFIGAAVMLLVVSLMCLGRVGLDHAGYAKGADPRAKSKSVITKANTAIDQTGGIQTQEDSFQDRMKKNFEWFRYREVIPKLHEIIISALPNAKTNPEQKDLYEAFTRGDTAKVKQIPRAERKQLFLTTISIFYADDLEKAQFRQSAMTRRDAMMRDAQMTEEGEGYNDEMMKQMEGAYGPDYMQQMMGGAAVQQKYPGFVITIEGYSPYRNIGALLDPPNVKEDRSRWGFVTRLGNLKQFLHLDVNSPFEIYPPMKDAPHFKLESGPADPDADIPVGVGEWQFIPDPVAPSATPGAPAYTMGMGQRNGTWILVDPMTKEIISAEAQKDQYGNLALDNMGKPRKIVHDYWFKLQLKLKWNDAPKSAAPAAAGAATSSRQK